MKKGVYFFDFWFFLDFLIVFFYFFNIFIVLYPSAYIAYSQMLNFFRTFSPNKNALFCLWYGFLVINRCIGNMLHLDRNHIAYTAGSFFCTLLRSLFLISDFLEFVVTFRQYELFVIKILFFCIIPVCSKHPKIVDIWRNWH